MFDKKNKTKQNKIDDMSEIRTHDKKLPPVLQSNTLSTEPQGATGLCCVYSCNSWQIDLDLCVCTAETPYLSWCGGCTAETPYLYGWKYILLHFDLCMSDICSCTVCGWNYMSLLRSKLCIVFAKRSVGCQLFIHSMKIDSCQTNQVRECICVHISHCLSVGVSVVIKYLQISNLTFLVSKFIMCIKFFLLDWLSSNLVVT